MEGHGVYGVYGVHGVLTRKGAKMAEPRLAAGGALTTASSF
jgi:hypothetical protein